MLKNKIKKFPDAPGVYIFFDAKKIIIYIGKATSLKSRVGSYFRTDSNLRIRSEFTNIKYERPIEEMIHQVFNVKIIETDSVLDALILESNLIKKHQPKYNILGKDDKSFSYFVITKEDYPKVLIKRKTDIKNVKRSMFDAQRLYGPYASKKQMEIALKIIRKIFPFHNRNEKSEKGCLDFQIGMCPGPYAGVISKKDYAKNIRGIKMILEGKKKNLVKKLEKEMDNFSKKEEFEKAGEIKRKIFALKHIQDIALISERDDNFQINSKFIRIEAYDISNISGQYAVGSMIVFDNSFGEIAPNKSEYRKFKIKTITGADDTGMMREVLIRRFRNNWTTPNAVFLDGGKGHLNMAEKLWKELGVNIPIVAVAKGITRKNQELRIKNYESKINLENIIKNNNLIKSMMDEAHRFAISYHRKVRGREFLK
ncbi:MAG: UvrB/UvrC motif-containing protein [Candidatus Moranbacteria bacterium]|jgi:excinuclease ABC subunit C|nr:UvrB/UvrC motif-containing protein [Candidatus Moranbacteria bacterium]